MPVQIMTVHFFSLNNPVLGVLIWIFNLIMLLNEPNENKVRYLQSSKTLFKIILYPQADSKLKILKPFSLPNFHSIDIYSIAVTLESLSTFLKIFHF